MLQEPFNEEIRFNIGTQEKTRGNFTNTKVRRNFDEESCQETQEEDFKILPFMQVHPTEERISKFIDIFLSAKGSKPLILILNLKKNLKNKCLKR